MNDARDGSATLPESCSPHIGELRRRIRERTATIGIVGLGYVGLPVAIEFARHFPQVIGFEVDCQKVIDLNAGRSHVRDIQDRDLSEVVSNGHLLCTTDFALFSACDAILICVPTPLTTGNLPDLSAIVEASEQIALQLRPGQIIILESTTYPGTTDELVRPILESSSRALDREFLLAFSPERIDPGGGVLFRDIPKVVGGCSLLSTEAARELYSSVVVRTHAVSTARAAETVKLLENTFRMVNIGLINEFTKMCRHFGIESSEVIEAASTKPFGFMPFLPGPGVGGHCIPLDPLYLSWKAKEHGFSSRFIELADQMNSSMSVYVVDLITTALNERGKSLRNARILILGVAYKKNIEDTRRSPALTVIDRLRVKGAQVSYHDPYVPAIDFERIDIPAWRPRVEIRQERRTERSPSSESGRSRRRIDGLESVPITADTLSKADCVVIVTDHSNVDYDLILSCSDVVIDTRQVISIERSARSRAQVYRL